MVFADNRMSFPDGYENGVMYEQVKRGNVIEDIYTTQAAIDAVKQGGKLPNGTIIVMEEYANKNGEKGNINRIIVMEKSGRDWQFDSFDASHQLNRSENPDRCHSCHKGSISGEDIVFTLDKMKAF